jgi:hypothetical protein
METSTIHIEALNTSLHGARILCQGTFHYKRMPPIMDAVHKLRDPFKKRIIASNASFMLSKYIPLQYDCMFQIKELLDWTLLLTYITYAPKPLLLVIEDMKIPDGLWQKLTSATTMIHITSQSIVNLRPYDAIFFAPMEELSGSFVDYTYKALQTIYKSSYSQKEHKEIVQELRVAGAGIVWTRIDEDKSTGNVYWYDPISQVERITKDQMGELLGYMSEAIKNL